MTLTPRSTEAAAWDAFRTRHDGHRFLEPGTPLYVIDPQLKNLIRREIPRFFTSRDSAFENDLAETVSVGFVDERAIGLKRINPALDARMKQSSGQIEEMLAEEYEKQGVKRSLIKLFDVKRADHVADIEHRQRGFLGWLVTNPDYWNEVAKLRGKWEAVVRKCGFTRLKIWLLHGLDDDRWPMDCVEDFRAFYLRWNLQTMTTWELPVPIQYDLGDGLQSEPDLQQAGLVMFLPWYLLAGEPFDVREALRYHSLVLTPGHLQQKNLKGNVRRRELGDISYAHIHYLYRNLILVLLRRYGPECKGRLEKLDEMFARCLKLKDHRHLSRLRRKLIDPAQHWHTPTV
jgi:hypothetical protein